MPLRDAGLLGGVSTDATKQNLDGRLRECNLQQGSTSELPRDLLRSDIESDTCCITTSARARREQP